MLALLGSIDPLGGSMVNMRGRRGRKEIQWIRRDLVEGWLKRKEIQLLGETGITEVLVGIKIERGVHICPMY